MKTNYEKSADHIRVLCLGDVVGRSGREALTKHLEALRRELQIDFAIVNGENAAGGVGIDAGTAEEIRAAGADVVTLGDHTWQRREFRSFANSCQDWCVRPANYPPGTPGAGATVIELKGGLRIGVANLMGRVFMGVQLDCPFRVIDKVIADQFDGCTLKLLDFHAEATSEKIAMGRHLDGRVSLVVGTHTHVQTADEQILPQGTGYITDLGMCGPTESVIGMDCEVALKRFTTSMPHAYKVAEGPSLLQGVWCDFDRTTGRALQIERIRHSEPVNK